MPTGLELAAQTLRFAVLSALLYGFTGWAVLRLLRFRPEHLSARVFLSGVAGVATFSYTHLLVAWIHPGLTLGVLAAVWGLALWWRPRVSGPDPIRPSLRVTASVLLSTGLAIIGIAATWQYASTVATGWRYSAYHDHLFHIGIIWEIIRSGIPEQMPWLAGEPFWSYHWFGDLLEATLVRYGALDVLLTHHVLAPALLWAWICLGLVALARQVSPGATLPLFGIAAMTLRLPHRDSALQYMHRNPPAMYGIILIIALFVLLADQRHRRNLASLLLANWLAAALLLFKANFFLFVLPAIAVWTIAELHHRGLRQHGRNLVLAWLPLLALIAFKLGFSPPRPLGLEYGLYTQWLAGILNVNFDSLGPLAPLAVLLYHAIRLGDVYLLLLGGAALIGARRIPWRAPLTAAVLTAIGSWLFVCLFLVEANRGHYSAWNLAGHTSAGVRAAVMLGAMIVLGRTLVSLRQPLRRWLEGLIVVALLASQSFNAVAEWRHWKPDGYMLVPASLTHVLDWAQAKAPQDAVILSGDFTRKQTLVSALSGRRMMIERSKTFSLYCPSAPDRRAVVHMARVVEDLNALRELVRPYGVTHILTTPRWGISPLLRLPVAARSGAYTLYTVPTE